MFTLRAGIVITTLTLLLNACGGSSSNDNANTTPPPNNLGNPPTATRSALDNFWKLDPADSTLNLASLVGVDASKLKTLRLLAVENPNKQKAEVFFCNSGTSISELTKSGSNYLFTLPSGLLTTTTSANLTIREKTAGSRYELQIPTNTTTYGLDLIPQTSTSSFKLNVASTTKSDAVVPANTNLLCGFSTKPSASSVSVNLAGALDASIGWIRLFYSQGISNNADLASGKVSLSVTSSEFTSVFGNSILNAKQGSVKITQCDSTQVKFVVDMTSTQNARITGEWLWQHQGQFSCPATVASAASATVARSLLLPEATIPSATMPISDSQRWDLTDWRAEMLQSSTITNAKAHSLLTANYPDAPVIACFIDRQQAFVRETHLLSQNASQLAWQADPLVDAADIYQTSATSPLLLQKNDAPVEAQAWCGEALNNNQRKLHSFWQQQPLTITVIGSGQVIGDNLSISIDSPALESELGMTHWDVPTGSISNGNFINNVGELRLQLPDQQWLVIHD
jgi:hypothetical protein